LPNSDDLYVLFYTDTMRRNLVMITIGAERIDSTNILVAHIEVRANECNSV